MSQLNNLHDIGQDQGSFQATHLLMLINMFNIVPNMERIRPEL